HRRRSAGRVSPGDLGILRRRAHRGAAGLWSRQGDWVGRGVPARLRCHRTEDAPQRGAGRADLTAMPLPAETRAPHRTKQEFVYRTIRSAILRCELRPGERLVIEDLAQRLD